MRVDLTDKVNPAFEKFFASHARDLIAYGGANAGKSWAASQKLIVKCFKRPKRRVAIIRKYGPALRDTCFSMITRQLADYGLIDSIKVNQTTMTIAFPNGSEMLFRSIADSAGRDPASRIKSLTDITDVWLEEPTELSFDEYLEVTRRHRGGDIKEHYPQCIFTFNPIDVNHWLKVKLCDKNVGEWHHFTYRDNYDSSGKSHCSRAEIDKIELLKDQDPVQYGVYANGEWGVPGNQIYTRYRVAEGEELAALEAFSPDNTDHYFAGVDFGFDPDPAVWLFMLVKGRTLFIRHEVYETRLINSQFIAKIKEYPLNHGVIPAFCDSSEPARITEMESAGIMAYPADKSQGSVSDGLDKVRSFEIVIHPDCSHTLKEIQGYKNRKDKQGNVLNNQPVKFNDHCMDALRYGIYTYFADEGVAQEEQYEPEVDEYEMEGAF